MTKMSPAFAAEVVHNDVITVHSQTFTHHFPAYAQIKPIAVIPVRTVYPGTLSDLRLVPGDSVTTGQILARISGPRMQSMLTKRVQDLHSAHARVTASQQTLSILRNKFRMQLATQEDIDSAQRELATAIASEQTAKARLVEARNLEKLRSPVAGVVMAIQASNGEQISSGQTLMTLLPADKLWIQAAYYGKDIAQLHLGMKGRFQPADDSPAFPVTVTAISSSLSPDGGRTVGLLPATDTLPAHWVSGQWGTVTLDGPVRPMVTIPTSALILDHGDWWVLLHTAKGDKPQKVTPGPSHGWQTWIASGLHTGDQIVVEDAYLKYHRGIARSYMPPD